MVKPMKMAEVSAPTRIANCCQRGVAPTRKPVLRSCEVVPPLEEAMQTTAATVKAVSIADGPMRPRTRKIRHVINNVAMVMPEMGLDDEPTSPVKREETVTNKKPNRRIMRAP